MNILTENEIKRWLESSSIDESTKEELKSLNEEEAVAAMNGYMTFGTAGLRAKMGAGTALMNIYTIAHATTGVASLILANGDSGKSRGVAIAYDSRNNSEKLARVAANTLTSFGIKVYIYPALRPTPCLSFALRELNCIAGINITASHNPSEYNGYKVYWEDGAQISPEQAKVISAEISKNDILETALYVNNVNEDLISYIGNDIDEKYKQNVLEQMVNPDAIKKISNKFNVIYTPLHGTGITMVPDVLKRAGLTNLFIVEEQKIPDGDFPTLKYPNPEFPEAFELGKKIANKYDSQLIIATDPDADRVGVMAKDKNGQFKCITGNQMGVLLLDYIITAHKERGTMPVEPYAVKSIVSTGLAEKICTENGVKMYDVLTGFKFIGEVIKNHLKEKRGTFLLGFEESYGYLKGTYARDKDAVVASLLICEMAAYYAEKEKTLCDAIEDIFKKYDYYVEKTESSNFEGSDGKEKMRAVMSHLRECPPVEIAHDRVKIVKDYLTGNIIDTNTGSISKTGLPESDILYYVCENCTTVVRPSGTEPKLKLYYMAHGKTEKDVNKIIAETSEFMKNLIGVK